MADAKITALTELTDPIFTDMLPIIDDPSGTPITKKITRANLLAPLFKVITADATGQNVATVQPWFPAAGAVTVDALTTYLFHGMLSLVTGATTHTTGMSFTGTASLTSIEYWAEVSSQTVNVIGTAISVIWVSVATNTVLNATSTALGTVIRVKGIIRVNAGGTLIPNFTFSADPTGTISVKRNTYFCLLPIGSNTVVSTGTWA